MNPVSEIEHNGVVHSIGKNTVVRITAHPSCSSCQASGVCNVSGSTEKYFEFPGQEGLQTGQNVKVITSLSTGFRALVLGYIIPLIVVLIFTILLLGLGVSELLAGIGSIATVAIYYLFIYLMRDKISRTIKFTLKPA
jgi:sigma-E factor negative regulatory protein RseC